MASRAVLFALAFVTVPLAGCLDPGALPEVDAPGGGSSTWVDPFISTHNHSDPAEHAIWSDTMRLVAHHALNPDGSDQTIGLYGEMDIVGDLGAVAVTGMGGETPGILMMDVADPAAPRILSFTASPDTGRLADVKLHPDGTWLFAAAQTGTQWRAPNQENVGRTQYWSSQNGYRIYDVSDPAAPVLTQALPSPSGYGCHMFAYKAIGDREWLFCVGRSIEVYEFNAAAGTLTFTTTYTPQSPTGVDNALANDPSNPQAFVATETRLAVTPHDMTVQDDPLTGDPVMVVSWWDLGARIVDISDPTQPTELGVWAGAGAATFEGNVHSAMLTLWNDKRVLVTSYELLRNDPGGVHVVDATDFAAMTVLGEWVNPSRHGAEGILFSPHNIQLAAGRIYLAHYHAGVFVLDLAAIATGGVLDPDAAIAAVAGYYVPHADVPTFLPRETVAVPDVWDVVVKDGAIYAVDIMTGLYVLNYAGDTLGDAAVSGFA